MEESDLEGIPMRQYYIQKLLKLLETAGNKLPELQEEEVIKLVDQELKAMRSEPPSHDES